MEESRWKAVRVIVCQHAQRKSTAEIYSDAEIVEVYYWSVIHDRPQGWATFKINWPIHLRRRRNLPSQGTLSRRLRSPRVLKLLRLVEESALKKGLDLPLVHLIDGKSLVIGGASKDRQAGYGRAAAGQAKGYKIHVLLGENGNISSWRLTPMQTSEKVMARRIVREVSPQGYLIGDAGYDDRHLHDQCQRQGELQLVAPRSRPKTGLGHHPKSIGRLRSIELLETSRSGFARQMLRQRNDIERWFGRLVSFGGGLACLPPWVRSYRRVRRWVGAKLVLASLRNSRSNTTYVAA